MEKAMYRYRTEVCLSPTCDAPRLAFPAALSLHPRQLLEIKALSVGGARPPKMKSGGRSSRFIKQKCDKLRVWRSFTHYEKPVQVRRSVNWKTPKSTLPLLLYPSHYHPRLQRSRTRCRPSHPRRNQHLLYGLRASRSKKKQWREGRVSNKAQLRLTPSPTQTPMALAPDIIGQKMDPPHRQLGNRRPPFRLGKLQHSRYTIL